MSKTPRQAFKENFWIGAKGGLLDQKHVKAMGDAVWLFLYLLRGQTGINEWGEGIFQYGHPVTKGEICADFGGVSGETIKRWTAILKAGDYIRIEFHSNKGTTFWIAKGKDKTKKLRKVVSECSPKLRTELQANSGGETLRSFQNSGGEVTQKFQNSGGDKGRACPQAVETETLPAPIPKGFISKNLSYYNTHAAAKTAAVVFPSQVQIQEQKQPQETPSGLGKEATPISGIWRNKEERAEAYRLLEEDMRQRKQA